MRRTMLLVAMLIVIAAPLRAQEWIEFQNNEDGFRVNFPGQPKVTDSFWATEQGYVLPSRIYSAEQGGGKYSMTVVDYTLIDRLGMDRSVKCPVGAETCQGQPSGELRDVIGPGYATQDIRDALIYASFKYISRPGVTVTDYLWNFEDLVEGHQLNLTNPDGSRSFVAIYMLRNKLYILDGTVPKGYPEPGLLQQSLGFVDKDGKGVRFHAVYSNEFHGLGLLPEPERFDFPDFGYAAPTPPKGNAR